MLNFFLDKKSCCNSLKKTKHEASEKKWNVKIPIELMQSVAARKNSNIKLETGESTQDKSRHTNNMINALKITTQSNGTLKNGNKVILIVVFLHFVLLFPTTNWYFYFLQIIMEMLINLLKKVRVV